MRASVMFSALYYYIDAFYSIMVRYAVNAGFKVICNTCLHFHFENSETVSFAHG